MAGKVSLSKYLKVNFRVEFTANVVISLITKSDGYN